MVGINQISKPLIIRNIYKFVFLIESMKEGMKELLFGKKNMTLAEKIRAWALWLIIFIVLMASLKILGLF